MEKAMKVQKCETNFYPEIERDAKRYRYLRQIDRCSAWSSLFAPDVVVRTEDIDEIIDERMAAPTPDRLSPNA